MLYSFIDGRCNNVCKGSFFFKSVFKISDICIISFAYINYSSSHWEIS